MNKTILVVDDEKIVCRAMQKLLEDEGYYVETAYDGRDGISLAKESSCGLAIVDFILPDINGLEVCRQIKEEMPQTKTVLMSGYATKLQESKEEFSRLPGCKEMIGKPFDIEEIITIVNNFFIHGKGC